MSRIQANYVGIISSVKPLYFLCKIAGLVPFSFSVDLETGTEIINTNIYSNIFSVAWSLLVFFVLVGGTIHYCFAMISSTNITAFYITAFMVSFPLTLLMSKLAILMNLTLNRQKFSDLWKKLNDIDIALLQYGGPRKNIWFKVEMAFLLLIILPWMCADAWLWAGRITFFGEAILRLSHLVQMLVVIQFCKLTQLLRRSLKDLNKALTVNIDNELRTSFIAAKEYPNSRYRKVNSIGITPVIRHISTQCILANVEDISEESIISNSFTEACSFLKIRRIYGQIYEAVDYVNSIYGLPMLLEFVRNILAVIVNIFQITTIFRNRTEQSIIYGLPSYVFTFLGACWVIVFISREAAVTFSCHMATSEARKIQDNVQIILLRQNIREETMEQLKLFSAQLTANMIRFTAFGFFTLSLSTLSTFIASVITYIVVLEQMK
ncbi:hypothetical protein B7P43_G15052 [Cryptotermes secundus]|uniref:Gustatory receptor n=1 Tax=Cryptotermes secundus TaxID=105785 RepID=A0A2J7QVN5_9NEOP|nr:hypothetical protein B7P43_G15052 [Cryptotermes secundus]